jgi:glycosyltransferase involved in cell wall biosynthesis
VTPGNAEALADSIAEALSDRHRLVVMGDAGRALVEREFSWAVVTDRLLDLYRQLLSPAGSL